jgi:hypothetical protein
MNNCLKLCDIQRILAKAIVNGELSTEISEFVCDSPPIAIDKRVEIYQQAFEIRMIDSLKDDFASVLDKIGEFEFKKIAKKYIVQHPSRYASLAEFSKSFPDFIKNISEELFELASVDWIQIISYYTKNIDPSLLLTAEQVASGIDFRLQINPSLNSFVGKNKISISYKSSDTVYVKEISGEEFQILSLLNEPLGIDGLAMKIENNNLKIEVLQIHISNWIKNEIIFCERV